MDDQKAPEMFDERIERIFRPTVSEALVREPELRSVVVIYDFHGPFNDVDGVRKGLWVSGDGSGPKPIDAVVGSLRNTLQCAAEMLNELFMTHAQLSDEILKMSQTILQEKQVSEDSPEGRKGQTSASDSECGRDSDADHGR